MRRQRRSGRAAATCRRARGVALMVALISSTSAVVVGLAWLTTGLSAGRGEGGASPDEAVGLAAVAGCWVCVGWFVLATACTAAAEVPGTVGRSCSAAAEVLAPWTLRKVVAAGLGLTVVTGPAAAASGQAHLEPGSARAQVQEHVDRTTSNRIGADRPPLDRPADVAGVVTVRPGDCLWSIAARHLGPGASDTEIAAAWPVWYAVNRAVIGADPNLVLRGQVLVVPR